MSVNYGYIYKTTNLINGRIYIGQHSGSFNQDYIGSGFLIKKAILKHGKINFKLEIIAYASTREMLNSLEIKHIAEYRELCGKEFLYNLTDGGEGGDVFSNHPNKEEIRNKLRKSNLNKIGNSNGFFGKHHTKEARVRISEAQKGRVISEETKKKISDANRGHGRKQSEEIKNKISRTLTGFKRPPFTKEHRQKLSLAHKKNIC